MQKFLGGKAMFNAMQLRIGGIVLLIILMLVAFFSKSEHPSDSPEATLKQVNAAIDGHDRQTFDRIVDIDKVLNFAYDDFVIGTLDSDKSATDQTRKMIGNFTDAIKIPLLNSVKESINNYVATGAWSDNSADKSQTTEGSDLLARTGLDQVKFRDIADVAVSEDGKTAVAHVEVSQADLDGKFTFNVDLERDSENHWRVVRIDNFKDFTILVYDARHIQIERYLKELDAITISHDKTALDYDLQYGKTLSEGSLGNDSTREQLRILMEKLKVDWENRKQEIFALTTPEEAETLQHLWIKVCDHQISYATGYALWMTDKKAETIHDADANLKQAKTLEQEAKGLMHRMELDLGVKEIPETPKE